MRAHAAGEPPAYPEINMKNMMKKFIKKFEKSHSNILINIYGAVKIVTLLPFTVKIITLLQFLRRRKCSHFVKFYQYPIKILSEENSEKRT